MASKPKERLSCRALVYLEPVELGVVGDPKAEIFASSSDSPVRAAIERRSDLAFVDTLAGHIRQEGIDPETTAQLTAAVLCSPTLKVKRAADNGFDILQSVVVRGVGEWGDLAVTGTFHAANTSGGLLRTKTVTVDVVEIDDVEEQLSLVRRVEDCLDAYPIPVTPSPPPDIPSWALLGDLTQYVHNAPPRWESRLKTAGNVYGRRPDLTKSPEHYKLRHVGQSTDWLLGLRGLPWVDSMALEDTASDITLLGTRGQDYASLESEIRLSLLTKARSQPSLTRKRALAEGEIVYHRKIGNGRKFDRFDAGSSEPCVHGADSFEPFTKAPKASKGMENRYTNFKSSMLVHCRRYPNCNVYGVDHNRG